MNVRQILQKLSHPNFTCDVCGREVFSGERICAACAKTLPWNNGLTCPLCGKKVLEKGVCVDCKGSPPKFDGARSALLHDGGAVRLITRFKCGEIYLVKVLTEMLMPLLSAFPNADSFAFVPMTKKAEKMRGYNQSRILAGELAQESGLELLEGIEKIRETDAQKLLCGEARENNLKDCFRLSDNERVKGRKIILVDDTFTTGATANEISALLKRKGAAKVFLLTVTSVQSR